jgi:hypothetical protein
MDANRPWTSRAVLAAALALSIAVIWPGATPPFHTRRVSVASSVATDGATPPSDPLQLAFAERALRKSMVLALNVHLDLLEARLVDAERMLAMQERDPHDLGGDGCIPAAGLGPCAF